MAVAVHSDPSLHQSLSPFLTPGVSRSDSRGCFRGVDAESLLLLRRSFIPCFGPMQGHALAPSEDIKQISILLEPIRLACGLELENRLVKAAMEPCLSKTGDPSEEHVALHSQWSQGRFGLLITENVQVCPRHLATPYDVVIPNNQGPIPTSWVAWAKACTPPTLVQLSHGGLQSPRGSGRPVWEGTLAPSRMRLSLGTRIIERLVAQALFNEAKEASENDIRLVVEQFRSAAIFVHRAGFQGVQLHCSHGYLLAQFISPKTNLRSDEYGLHGANQLKLLFEIIDAIRACVPSSFCLAIKLNSSDFVSGGLTEDDALNNVKMIAEHGGIDLIEISGGTYENVGNLLKWGFMSAPAARGNHTQCARSLFFGFFCARVRGHPESRRAMASAVSAHLTDLVGIGRPTCIDPLVSTKILDPKLSSYTCPSPFIPGTTIWNALIPVKLIGTGFNTVWYTWQLQRLANLQPADLNRSAFGCIDSEFCAFRTGDTS
ncbi:hypothetical protein O181_045268 [Austropuccinia psidii MF-1]|uniref:NADH:flavin oxidoreductase/NADH oxidase N-terminal domain-containing protein n=1 Tax=Austropuccinia psidii MF-1 TaxID=1389203 RepID=A0A9Q3HHG0_9BASI|nr:hypothetical protein [Austropuccinia psidii MF-1]